MPESSPPPPTEDPLPWLVGLGLVAWAWVAMPPGEYTVGGHESAYFALARGEPPDAEDLAGWATMAFPRGIARAFGVFGGEAAWTALNRLALLPAVALVGSVAAAHVRRVDPPAARAAGRAALLPALAAAPLVAWSCAGLFVAPAAALGLAALRVGLSGRVGLALVLGLLAAGGRFEALPLLLAAALAPGREAWRAALARPAGLVPAAAVAGGLLLSLPRTGRRMPVESLVPDPELAWSNLALIPLGGPVLGWGAALLLAACAVVLRRRAAVALPPFLVLGLAAAVAQVAWPVDLGARHLVPASVLAACGLGAAVVLALRVGPGRLLVRVSALPLVVLAAFALAALPERYSVDGTGLTAADRARFDAAPVVAWEDVRRTPCVLLLPGGDAEVPLARDLDAPAGIAAAARDARRRPCVELVVGEAMVFRGDTRADRFDRAVRTLGLHPAARVQGSPREAFPTLWRAGTPRAR